MTDREKLIELIIDAKRTDQETGGFTEHLADHLIANGVTVQQWIPVTERLPESGKCVIIACENGNVAEGCYQAYGKKWVQFRWSTERIDVTHWMPLPQPPKGE